MKSKKEEFISEGLEQVWAWKDAIHQEVADLPIDEAMKVIHNMAREVAVKYPQFRRAMPQHVNR